MRNATVLVLLVLAAAPGCYLGREGAGKKVAYAVNGLLVAGGLAMAMAPDHNQNPLQFIRASDLAVVPILAGMVGLILNAVTTPERHPAALATVRAPLALSIRPGLRPSAITLAGE